MHSRVGARRSPPPEDPAKYQAGGGRYRSDPQDRRRHPGRRGASSRHRHRGGVADQDESGPGGRRRARGGAAGTDQAAGAGIHYLDGVITFGP